MITTRRIRLFLVALLTTSGVLHLVRPGPFVSIVPRSLPRRAELVAISGAAELVCAALLAHPAGRAIGGPASAALFAAVFPANVSMALRSGSRPLWYRVLLWARLPLQIPLVTWSLRIGRHPLDPNLAYLSYYSGGLRAVQIQCTNPADTSTCELAEVGGYLDPAGNNFWGVETFVRDGQTIILASDRDSGLWIFEDP